MERPPMFACKKWTIVGLTAFNIIVMFIMMIIICAMAEAIAEEAEKHTDPHNKVDIKTAKNLIIAMAVIFSLLSILFSAIGFFGALKENYCLSVTYCVLSVIGLIMNVVGIFNASSYWASAIIQLAMVILSVLFVRDLHKMRQSSSNYA